MKNSIKKIIYTTLTVSMLMSLMASSVQAVENNTTQRNNEGQPATNSGRWGNASWNLQSDGALILNGKDIGNPKESLSSVLTAAEVSVKSVKNIQIVDKLSANNINRAFADFPNLQKITGLNKLDYSGSAYCMFIADPKLTSIDLVGFKTDKITNMAYMFDGIQASSIDLSDFDTSNVTTMFGMFDGATALKSLDISNFNTKKVTDMSYMFTGLTVDNLDVSKLDTSNVMNMSGMFDGMTNVSNLIVNTFDTSKVTNMEYMFSGAKSLEGLDLSSFNTGNVKKMKGMFSNTNKLSHIKLSNFVISSDTDTSNMFAGATGLSRLDLGTKTQLKLDMKLPTIAKTDKYTGYWQNVGTGTVSNPAGDNVWTSDQLLNNFNSETMGDDIYIWQKKSSKMSLGVATDYSNDLPLSTYLPSAIAPLHPYRYNVVLNNKYPFYSKLTEGQSDTENIIALGDETGVTIYNRKTMPVTYTTGNKKGQTIDFVQVSDDGINWYWIDEHALNLDLASTYPSVNKDGHELIDGMFLSSTNIYGTIPHENTPVNSQMIGNSFNQQGKIIYESQATEADFSSENDSKAALKAFNDNLDKAVNDWNNKLGMDIFVKKSATNDEVSLKISASTNGSATLYGNTGIDKSLVKYAMDSNSPNLKVNLLFITMRHELGHSLGLNHTSHAQYMGMPDNYQFSIDDDVMNAVLNHTTDGYPWTQKTITDNDINAVKLILANHNFENPKP